MIKKRLSKRRHYPCTTRQKVYQDAFRRRKENATLLALEIQKVIRAMKNSGARDEQLTNCKERLNTLVDNLNQLLLDNPKLRKGNLEFVFLVQIADAIIIESNTPDFQAILASH